MHQLFSFIFLVFSCSVYAQKNIKIEESSSVSYMMEKFIEYGKSNENIKAWRIQIITTDDRREMERATSSFTSQYPTVSMDWKHVIPYYQVRVGAYENKTQMMPFLLELKKLYPGATPIYDNINKRTLINNN